MFLFNQKYFLCFLFIDVKLNMFITFTCCYIYLFELLFQFYLIHMPSLLFPSILFYFFIPFNCIVFYSVLFCSVSPHSFLGWNGQRIRCRTYRLRQHHELLQQYVRFYWYATSHQSQEHKTHVSGMSIFHEGEKVEGGSGRVWLRRG